MYQTNDAKRTLRKVAKAQREIAKHTQRLQELYADLRSCELEIQVVMGDIKSNYTPSDKAHALLEW